MMEDGVGVRGLGKISGSDGYEYKGNITSGKLRLVVP